uniref:Dystonin n=1 Tax=Timema shepardi TaxID=629360 RepID=A0A7R9APN2_TIMSH|nr:unnamed protein product [Timema shepardi]
MSDLEKREIQFSAVQDRGESLVLQHHPAAKCIEAHMAAMQTQWAWLLQLTLCLETHLKHATTSQKFYREVREADTWINKRDEMLNTVYSQSDFTLDEGERLLKGMQELREELNHFGDIVQNLSDRSKDIVPLKQRRQPVTRPLPVQAICTYKQVNIVTEKGEQCVLYDNSGRIKWRVTNSAGLEGSVPGVCFLIPPPDKEALDAVERLKRQFDRSITLWQKKQLRMRQNMIFATIKVVKAWDLAQFLAMGHEQRNAIRRALNEDADKLLQEGDPADPQLRRLRREMEEVNRLFDEFERKARAEEDSKNASRTFGDQIGSLQAALDEAERTLNLRLSAPLPRDLDSLEHLVIEHKEFETRLQALSPEVEEAQSTFRSIARKTPALQTKLDKVVNKWNQLWNSSHLYIERLKCVEIVLSGLEETTGVVSEFELKLASYEELPSDLESLQAVHEDLLNLQNSVSQQQIVIDQLNEDAHNARRLVEKSRPNHRGPHHDLDRLDNDVNRLTNRWTNVCSQLVDRLRSCEAAYGLLKNYTNSYQTEVSWVDDSYTKLNNLSPIGDRAKEQLEPTRIYDLRLQRYSDWLIEEVHPSLDVGVKRPGGRASSADHVVEELDILNHRYQALLGILYDRLRQIASLSPEDPQLQLLVAQMEPRQLRTFRTEFNIFETTEESRSYSSTTHYSQLVQEHSSTSRDVETSKSFSNGHPNKSTAIITVTTPSAPSRETSPTKKRTNIETEVYVKQGTNNYPSATTRPSTNGEAVSGSSPTKIRKESPTKWSGSSMQFSEIKSLKKIHKVEEGIGTDDIIRTPGIVHPTTGEILTVGDAIKLRILDVRMGQIATSPDNKTPSLSIREAAERRLVDPALAEQLLGPCGIVEDDGVSGERQLSLLEAIQRELFDAERGFITTTEERVKVTYDDGKRRVSIAEAVSAGSLDPETGQYTDPITKETMTIVDAYSRQFLQKEPLKEKKKTENGLALADAINQGLVDDRSGQIVDRNSGDKFPITEAIKRGVIDPEVREIVDAPADNKVTLSEAIKAGIFDPKKGKYIHGISQEILPLREASRRQLVIKPMTLKDCVDLELIDDSGRIFSPTHSKKLPLLECVSKGVLDSDNSKSVTNTQTNELLTLSQALAEGIILPAGKFRDASTGEVCTIPEAVDRGLITSVSVKSIFDIDGFKDPNSVEFISLNAALARGIINPGSGVAMYVVDSKTGKSVSMDEGVKKNLVRPEVLEMLNRKIGIKDRGRELTVLEAVAKGYLDPKTGQVIDPKTKKTIPLDEAVQRRLITPEGAALLGSLVAITVTTQTITKTIKRYVTVTREGVTTSEIKMTFGEAVRQGLIDEISQTFRDPDSGRVISVTEALSEGLIGSSSPDESPNKSPVRQRSTDSPLGSPVKGTVMGASSPVKESSRGGSPGKGKTSGGSSPVKEKLFERSLSNSSQTKGRSPTSPTKEKVFDVTIKTRTSSPVKDTSRGSSPTKKPTRFSPEPMDTTDFTTERRSSRIQDITTDILTDIKSSRVQDITTDFLTTERNITSLEKQVVELPPEGWFLSEAIDQKLFDPVTGLFIIPGTDRLVSFKECVNLEIINPLSATVIDPHNNRKLTLLRSLEKKVLDPTGHYINGDKKVPMKEAIAKNFILLEERMEEDNSSPRLIQITKVNGKPDLVEVSNVGRKAGSPIFTEIKSSEATVSNLEPLQVAQGIIFDPSTALVIFTESGKSDNLLASVIEGKLEPRLVKVKDPYTGKTMNINEAMRKGIVDKDTGDYKDKTGRKISLADAAKFGLVAVLGAPLVAATQTVKMIRKALVKDPKTGEEIPIEVAFERGLIDEKTLRKYEVATENFEGISPKQVVTTKTEVVSTSVVIQDPSTGKEITAAEAIEKGLITPKELKELTAEMETQNKDSKPIKTLESTTIPLDDDSGPSLGEQTRGRVTTEPKYKVCIGRARSFSQSPEREAKPVVLQKMRKKIVKPKDAVEAGIIDKETADLLDKPDIYKGSDGESLSLAEAVNANKLDGNKGAILDSQRGDVLTIKEALNRGILDSSAGSGRLLVPIARSLSLPSLVKQGLIDPKAGKIVHPETGANLSLREAIMCEIVDPLSKIVDQIAGKKVTLEEAIAKGTVDEDKSLIMTTTGSVDILTAVKNHLCDKQQKSLPNSLQALPPVGMTFPVVLKRGLVDPKTKEVIHPITGIRRPVEEAIKNDFIMALPYPVSPFSVEVTEALELNLIDKDKGIFKNPKTGEEIPISEAVETGLLVVKPTPQLISYEPAGTVTAVTETVTSYHTITTKTIELKNGYILIGPNEVKNTQSGEVLPLEEARKRGIVKDESETKEEFTTREIKMSFSDAVAQGLVDMDAGTYTNPVTGKVIPINEAIKDGLLDTTEEPQKSPTKKKKKLNIQEAFDSIYDDKTKKFRDPNSPTKTYTFIEALDAGLIDPNSIVYDVTSGKPFTTRQAVDNGLLDSKTGRVKDRKTGQTVNVKEAAKMGLLAIVGVPVLAGMAVAEKISSLKDKFDKKESDTKVQSVPVKSSADFIAKEKSPYTELNVNQVKSPSTKGSPSRTPERETSPTKSYERQSSLTKTPSREVSPQKSPDRHKSPQKSPERQKSPPKSPTITIKTKTRTPSPVKEGKSFTPVQIKLSLKEAVITGAVNPETCEITVKTPSGDKKITVQEALDRNLVDPNDVIDVINKSEIALVDEKTLYKIQVTKYMNADELVSEGVYDLETESFLDPQTGNPIRFKDFVLQCEVFDPDLIMVKDPSTRQETFFTLRDAFEVPLVDRVTGHMVDPSTGKHVPFFEAIKMGWIVAKPSKDKMVPKKILPSLTLQKAVADGLVDPNTGEVKDPITGEIFSFVDALGTGVIDPKSVSIRNPENDDILPLSEAVEIGIVDLNRGIIVNVETRTEVEFKVAFLKGYIVAGLRKPASLESVIRKGLYEPKSGKILDPLTKEGISLTESVKRGLVDAFITECKDTRADSFVSLDDALTSKLVNSDTGKLRDTTSAQLLTLDAALDKGLIITNKFTITLIEAIVQEYYSPVTGKISNPLIGEETSVKDAIDSEFIDIASIRTGLMIINGDGEKITLEEAMRRGEISRDALTVKDPRSGDIITLNEAIKIGVIDPKLGTATDPTNGAEMHFYDALERGLIVPAKRKFSLPEAVFKGFYDPKSGKFTNPETREKLPTDRAIKRGIIDPASTLVKGKEGKVTTFNNAVEEGVIDARSGTITSAGKFGRKLDFQEAFEQGLLIEVRRPMSLSEALMKGVFDEETGKFLDPSTGEYLTLADAVENNLIESDSVHVKDTRSGFWKKVSLADAIKSGFVDGETAQVKDFTRDNLEVSIKEAFDIGLIVDSKAAVSIQRAIHQGLYDETTGKFTDPNTGRKITLHEAIRRFIINPQLPCYWDKKSERLLSLVETCRGGIIDRRAGMFKEPGANCTVTLSDAMDLGLIVDIESAGFGLYEAIAMGLYDVDSGRFVHPSTGRKLMLSDACKEELINPLTSIVKHSKTNKYMKLPEAVEKGLIDDEKGVYKIPDAKRTMTLKEAKQKGLIVTSRKPLSIEEAIRCGLYRTETGRFVNPDLGDHLDLSQALIHGLIDANTTAIKDPTTGQLKSVNSGIEDSSIDVARGRVVDPKTKRAYNMDVALDRGLLVTVERPITFQQAVRRGSIDFQRGTFKDPRTMRECTLEEAIKYELIDPESAVVKDPQTGRFRTLKKAITDGVIDLNKRAAFDPQTGKVKPLCIIFEQGTVVFLREPLTFNTAIEQGHLDVSTGKFTDPQSKEVLTLKETVSLGLIDPDSALIKDSLKKKLVKLPEAFRKGLMDAEKGNVLDSESSRLYSLSAAIESGLLTTPRRGLSLIEGLQFGLYNPTTGGFMDPFFSTGVIDRRRLTLAEAIESGLIDPSTTVIKDAASGNISSLTDAITDSKLIDATAGKMRETSTGKNIDLLKALEWGYILTAEARQAVEEKYRHCDETLSKLLSWLGEVEDRLANQDVVQESAEELRNQINTLKQIKDDLDAHQRPVASCLDQIRQVVATGGDVLSGEEVSTLEKNGRSLKSRYERSNDRTDRLLKRLIAAREELSKFRSELTSFVTWLDKARLTLEEKERALSNLNKLHANADSTREFVSDVIAHQADLRFITMAAQKFVDESKEYLSSLNEFRTSLPQRLPHIEPPQETVIRNEVSAVTAKYRDLHSRANALSDRLSGVGGRQREYRDTLDKARSWLREAEPKANKILSEPVGAEPRAIEEQLNRAKALNNEFVAQGRLVDNAKQAVSALLRSLEGQQSPAEMAALESPVKELENKYNQLSEALSEKVQSLDTALVQSQGVADALDSLMQWLSSTENQLKALMRPVSLNKERLEEQLREHRLLQAEVDSHRASVESVTQSAEELVTNASNARLAKKIETKLRDLQSRFEKLQERTVKRSELLDEIHHALSVFTVTVSHFEQWHAEIIETIESRDILKLEMAEYTAKIETIAARRDAKRGDFEEIVLIGKNLVAKKDVTDTVPVRDKIKALEGQWKDLNSLLEEKQRLSKTRSEQLFAYEKLRDSVLNWLNTTESRVSRLEPVAVEIDTLKQQTEQLKPLNKEYRDYGSTIDKVNDLGNQYDSLLRGERAESPPRRRSSAYSPTKRTSVTASPLRRQSQDAGSPSPTKPGGFSVQSPVSPGGSSGFSSRRSSQDGFHLEELSPVQQQLTEINNRYSLLGVRLSDRQSELDLIREEVKKHLDNLRTLGNFLDKVNRNLPKETVPQSKEEAGKTSKQIKGVLEEMYEKQSLLDSTKVQVTDLLKRKPGALGADTLHDELTDVTSRWKSLNDRCKDRIKFMEDLKDFHDTHDHLSNWLSAKDRMMTVLGPISSDSRMVQSQVQQVQVLREEFRSQQPQLHHLTEVGESVLSNLDEDSPDGHRLASKLSSVLQRWADLLGRLEERAESLGAAADTSREFDAGLNRLRDALQGISDNLDDLPLDKDPEEQLRKVENLERQLEGQRPLLADAESAGEQLCEVLSDPASRAEIQGKLTAVGRQYNNLQKKLDHRKAELENSLRDGRQFEASCATTLGWLMDELGGMSERLLVSADRHTLQQQLDHHEPVYKEVMNKEHEVIMLLNKGRDMLSRINNQRTDNRNLQRDLDKIQQQWDKLRKDTLERNTRLQTCMEHCRKYYRAQESLLPWLSQAEDKLETLQPASFKRKDIERQLKELGTFRNEVWKRSGEYENNRTLGDTFHGACDIDKEVVKGELLHMKQRWDKLNNDLLERTQSLEDTARRLSDFNENLRDLQHSLQRCEDKLSSHDALGGAAKDPKLLDRIKTLREETAALKKPLLSVRQLANDLVNEAGEHGADASHLQDEVETLADRLDELTAKLDDRCSELQSAATAVTQFNDQVKGLTHDLSDLENELDSMKPPGRDLKTVRGQLDDTGKLVKKINKASGDVANTVLAGEHLVDSGFAPDTATTREQVELLQRQLGRLDERARAREEDLDASLGKLENFYQIHTAVMEEVGEASEEVRKMKAVSSEVEGIKTQQQDFRSFQKTHIDPLSHQIEGCNRLGQGLIQSAAGGVNTASLEKDLEKMNDKWNDLKGRLNERGRKLDVGLLQSGKFQEALDGLAKWLADTEEMVANQKPPSADYKVVKAQLQEQKFLKKMLLDRQNSMSSLFSMGNEVAAAADPVEKKAIERQLKELMQRFDNLTEGASQRMTALEQAMSVAKDFQDKMVPLLDWLDRTEKKVKDMELVPTDEEKIQQRIKEQHALHNDILRKKPDFSDLTEVASNLMSLVGEDEALLLADKLQETTDRYTALVAGSEDVGQLLEASRAGLRHLVLTYQDLQAWMEGAERRLGKYRVLAVHTDKLLEQMDDLADLTEEIANHQAQVDGTVDSGLELMKHISNDEALQLKDKLDSLQRRYNDLTSRGADLLKHAHEALPLVQQFYNCHNRLVDWMMGAEAQIQSAEPREEDIARLELDIQEFRPVLESINQRSLEVIGDIDELLDWFREVDGQLRDAEPPSSDSSIIRVQLKEHRALNDDISSQKGRVRDVLSTAKKVLRESAQHEDTATIREKMEDLRETMDSVSALSSDRLGVLEQALPLAEHFHETHAGLGSWLDDMEQQVSMLAMPALRPDLIAQQQDRNEMFIQSISEHKPLVEKLNKTGEALIKLCNDEEGGKVQDILDTDNSRYGALRGELRARQQALERALQESSQFSDKLEGMLRALASTADQVSTAEPVSAHPPRIRDQIEENTTLSEDLDKRENAYDAVKRAADDVILKAGNRADPAVKDIKRKLDRLNSLWNEVQKATNDRGKSLEDALSVAERFWQELTAVMGTLQELQDSLSSQEPPAVEPSAIKEQQTVLQEIRQEIDQTKPEVDQCRQTGQELMILCGEPDKPEVKKHIEDLDSAWDNITALYAKREENLIDAMEKAMEFHETLQNLQEFLDSAEDSFAGMGALGSDIVAVKKQIEQLKDFKSEVDPHMVKVEALNRQAQELTERTSADQAAAIKEPLSQVNRRWDDLLRGMVERQRQLENALLRLGQFQHALTELLVWIERTDKTLDELKPVAGDPQVLEVELAKLKVLVNDIQAHQTSVDTLNDAGRQLIESGKGTTEASTTQEKLSKLNRHWRDLIQKTADRQLELEDALKEAQRFHAEIQDLLSWLGDVDGVIAASKPVGGLPETASEQLERFMEVFTELEQNRPKVETVLQQGQEYLKKSGSGAANNLQHNLRTLKHRWDSVTARASDKKIKLEIALKEATDFHDALQAFVDWLTNAEKNLSSLKPVSRVMETILHQIEEHKAFQKDVGVHRETMLNLDKKGTHLKYFSQKQDVILIKNLLISVQHRWERVVSKSAERTRALDHGYKEARDFHDSWSGLMTWLGDTEKSLDELATEASSIGNDPERIKARLAKHREFQRALSGKQATYDATMKAGKALKERAPKTDEVPLKQMLADLKNKWTTVCTKSVDRQRKLEEALLFSGQFKDAVQALLEWLQKVEKVLGEEGPVHGDLDTVMSLVEQHKTFEEDLHSRSAQMESVQRTGRDLEAKATAADAAMIKAQLSELSGLWDKVTMLSNRKTDRLEDALKEAEQLHKSVHMLLEWLSDAEMKLRFAGPLPEDEQETRNHLAEHEKFMREMAEKAREKDATIELAQRILAKAHPDGATVIKHWITIIQSRWEEVFTWGSQREQRLTEHLRSLRDLEGLLEELLAWLAGLEGNLIALETEPLPDDLKTLEGLITDHREFMENTSKRQVEVDSVCKSRQVKQPPTTQATQSSKDRKLSKPKTSTPSKDQQDKDRGSSPEHDIPARKSSMKPSSSEVSLGPSSRKGSRVSPGREKAPELPHIGPRFAARGSKGAEPQFRNPRVKLLWDRWRNMWMLAWERQRRLQEKYNYLLELEKVKNFSWDDWRKRFLKFMNHKKSRLTDLFRKMDKNNDGLIPREDFIDGIMRTKFDTSRLEMNAVADLFDRNGEGLIDWQEFIAALRPDWEEKKAPVEADKIHDEVKRLVMLCTCRQKFRVFQVGEGKYRFGDSQKLRLVRILRSTVMVRVGGGWVALDEFLVKNDPCRGEYSSPYFHHPAVLLVIVTVGESRAGIG